jgi:DNA-binding NtrC family response regulator
VAGSVAPTEATVLVTGEMGAGKDVVARLIHALSRRASGPLVMVHCGALPEGMVESELYGHTRGAFPGAAERRVGLLAQASGGTIILDEIAELPLRAQAKLVRALEDRAITPVGAAHPVAIDVRVVAATHRDLEALCAIGQFREDLRYCLDVVHVDMPPLRARREDIPPLVAHFLTLASRRLDRPLAMTKDCLQALVSYSWPGNVRELQYTVDRMASLATGPTLEAELLPPRVRASAAAAPPRVTAAPAGIPALHPALLERRRRKVSN